MVQKPYWMVFLLTVFSKLHSPIRAYQYWFKLRNVWSNEADVGMAKDCTLVVIQLLCILIILFNILLWR